MRDIDVTELEDRAGEVAALLKSLGNDKRLLILCKLVQAGEMNVTTLAAEVGLSQSALSQHLAKLRADDLVRTRRDSQTIWYSIGDARTEELMAALYQIFCADKS